MPISRPALLRRLPAVALCFCLSPCVLPLAGCDSASTETTVIDPDSNVEMESEEVAAGESEE